MTFLCAGCHIEKDFQDCRFWRWPTKGEMERVCKECRHTKASVPDVYWDGKPEENLADDPRTGKPRIFLSKSEKAAYLRERGIMEAGDKVHGAPVMIHKNQNRQPDNGRHDVKMALKRVKEMGRDRRHQEYLRITKEGRRYA